MAKPFSGAGKLNHELELSSHKTSAEYRVADTEFGDDTPYS